MKTRTEEMYEKINKEHPEIYWWTQEIEEEISLWEILKMVFKYWKIK